jgi:OFA family oxalate/formate antiporter-like MFS transporter
MSSIGSVGQQRGFYYFGWNVVAACVLSQAAVNSLALNSISLFFNEWSKEFHAPVSQLVLSVGLLTLVAAMSAPLVGVLADRYPARRLFGIGLVGVSAFAFLISITTASWQVLLLYGLFLPMPLCLATAVPSNSLISRWFVRRIGFALGLSAFGIGLAGVVVPPIVSHLLQDSVNWRTIWQGGGAICLLVVLPLVLLGTRNRPDPQHDGAHYLTHDDNGGKSTGHGATLSSSSMTIREVLRRRNFWIIALIVMPILAVQVAVSQNMAPYAIAHGLSRETAGELIAILSFSHLVANLSLGLLSDRYGNRLGFAIIAITAVAACLVLAFATDLPGIRVGAALAGLAGGVMTLLAAAIAAEFGAAGFGRAYGLVLCFLPLDALSAAVIAKVHEVTGSYAPAFVGMAILLLVPCGLLLVLRERKDAVPVSQPAVSIG